MTRYSIHLWFFLLLTFIFIYFELLIWCRKNQNKNSFSTYIRIRIIWNHNSSRISRLDSRFQVNCRSKLQSGSLVGWFVETINVIIPSHPNLRLFASVITPSSMARRKRSGSKAQYSAVLRYYTNHTIEVPLFEARAVGKVHLCTAAPSRHTRSWVYKSRADKNASQEGETERRKERKGAEEVAVAVEGACRGEERRGGKAKEILSPVPAPPTPAVTTRFCRSRQFLFDISSTNGMVLLMTLWSLFLLCGFIMESLQLIAKVRGRGERGRLPSWNRSWIWIWDVGLSNR